MQLVLPNSGFRPNSAAVAGVLLAAAASCDDRNLTLAKGPQIMLTPPSAAIVVGDSAVFSVTTAPRDSVRWTSSARLVATVSATGVARGVGPGRAIITVAALSRPGIAASAVVDVRAP